MIRPRPAATNAADTRRRTDTKPSGAKVGAAIVLLRAARVRSSSPPAFAPFPRIDQRPDQIADHVMQEGVGVKIEEHHITPAAPPRPECIRRTGDLAWHSAARKR